MLKTEKKKKNGKKCYCISIYVISCILHRQMREIPWLKTAQMNYNNWILCTTKSCQPPSPGSPCPLAWSKKATPRPLFKFQPPLRTRRLQCMIADISLIMVIQYIWWWYDCNAITNCNTQNVITNSLDEWQQKHFLEIYNPIQNIFNKVKKSKQNLAVPVNLCIYFCIVFDCFSQFYFRKGSPLN